LKEKTRAFENHQEVFLTAFSLLFIEILFFKTALYILDYLHALMAVAYALCGLAAGAVAAHRMDTLSNKGLFWIKILLVFSLFLCFLNFVFFSSFLFLSPVLILPFAAGNVLISYYIKENNAHGVYFADLAGAATGVMCATFILPGLREENCFLLVGIVVLFSIRPLQAGRKSIRVAALASGILGLVLLGLNLHLDWINLARITIPSKETTREKIFHHHELDLLYSKGSNVQRIEVLSPYFPQAGDDEAPPILYVAFNGLVNDVVRPENYDRLAYRYDPRVIYGLVEKPDFLVIGTSAEGVVKTAAAHGGKVTGLEINPQIVELMKGPLLSYSKNAYDLLESLHTMDARTYLNAHSNPFDIITLMNSHMARQSGLIGPPEFLHTREAIQAYWTHLTDEGYLVFEEKYYRDSGTMSSIKILATILDVLKAQGVQNPGRHLFVYHWILNGLSILGDPGQSSVSHVMIVVKKSPFSPANWEAVRNWATRVEFYYRPTHDLVEIFPVDEKPSEFTSRVRDIITESHGSSYLRASNDFSVITDDKPFPWSVDKDHTLIKSYLIKIGLVCLLILMGLAVYGVRVEKTVFSAKLLLLWAYFALTGLGYFVIEIGLMNFYQIFMGSPTHAFIFILGALLLSSGMGSWFSRRFAPRGSLLTFTLILIICAFHQFFGRQIISILGAGPLHNSTIIALMVFPLGFCMGIPFPLGIETAKTGLGRDRAAIFFAVNTLFSAFAVIFGFYLSVAHGFKNTFATGIGLYAVSFLIIAALFHLFHQKAQP
jgi:hypothetical protein